MLTEVYRKDILRNKEINQDAHLTINSQSYVLKERHSLTKPYHSYQPLTRFAFLSLENPKLKNTNCISQNRLTTGNGKSERKQYEGKKTDISDNLQVCPFTNQILSRVDYTNIYIYQYIFTENRQVHFLKLFPIRPGVNVRNSGININSRITVHSLHRWVEMYSNYVIQIINSKFNIIKYVSSIMLWLLTHGPITLANKSQLLIIINSAYQYEMRSGLSESSAIGTFQSSLPTSPWKSFLWQRPWLSFSVLFPKQAPGTKRKQSAYCFYHLFFSCEKTGRKVLLASLGIQVRSYCPNLRSKTHNSTLENNGWKVLAVRNANIRDFRAFQIITTKAVFQALATQNVSTQHNSQQSRLAGTGQ